MSWYNTNYRAKTAAALRMLDTVELLGGRATPADIGMLVKVCTPDEEPETCEEKVLLFEHLQLVGSTLHNTTAATCMLDTAHY